MSELAERPVSTRSRLSAPVARLRESPALPLIVLGCVVLAALSLILPSPPGKSRPSKRARRSSSRSRRAPKARRPRK